MYADALCVMYWPLPQCQICNRCDLFSRREYFGKEIEAVRVRNEDDIRKRHEIMAQAKERVAAEVAARAKAKGKGDMIGNSGSQ